MYEDMYKDYSNECFKYSYPYSFDERNKKYLQFWPPVNAWWYYGETITLDLKVTDKEHYATLDGNQIILTFYNFRKEPILEETFDAEAVEVVDNDFILKYFIDEETSQDICKRDVYYCGIALKSTEDEVVNFTVVLNRDNYLIRVI